MRLADGTEVLLDPEDEEFFGRWPWHRGAQGTSDAGYAVRKGRRRQTVLLHREIAARRAGRALRSGELVHHDNEDPFDNRRENLIGPITRSQHGKLHAAAMPRPRRELNPERGVYPFRGRWQAKFQHRGQSIYVGTFASREKAVVAVQAERARHGVA